jgi:hypothetical protein
MPTATDSSSAADLSPAGGSSRGTRAGTDVLTTDQQDRLLGVAAQAGRGRRDVVIVLLALRAGIDAREQCRLDVQHVAPGSGPVGTYVVVPGRRGSFAPALPRNAVPIPDVVRAELQALVTWKRERCPHGEGRFGKDVGPDGLLLCHVCRQPLDFARTPLLDNRVGQRLSERQVHKVFAKLRDRAGLPPEHTLGTLVRTWENHLRDLLIRAVQNDR